VNIRKRQSKLLQVAQKVFVIISKNLALLLCTVTFGVKFDMQAAQFFEHNIFRAIKIYKDIEKKMCICYYLCSGNAVFCGRLKAVC